MDFITMPFHEDEAVRLRFWDLYRALDHKERAVYDRVVIVTALEVVTDADRAAVAAIYDAVNERVPA